jgi:hypothetical protein
VTMKNGVFWDVTPCGSWNRRFEGNDRLHYQGNKNRRGTTTLEITSILRLLVIANVVPSSPIPFSLAIRSSETSVLTRAPQRHILEYGILSGQNYCNLHTVRTGSGVHLASYSLGKSVI